MTTVRCEWQPGWDPSRSCWRGISWTIPDVHPILACTSESSPPQNRDASLLADTIVPVSLQEKVAKDEPRSCWWWSLKFSGGPCACKEDWTAKSYIWKKIQCYKSKISFPAWERPMCGYCHLRGRPFSSSISEGLPWKWVPSNPVPAGEFSDTQKEILLKGNILCLSREFRKGQSNAYNWA